MIRGVWKSKRMKSSGDRNLRNLGPSDEPEHRPMKSRLRSDHVPDTGDIRYPFCQVISSRGKNVITTKICHQEILL